MLWKFLLKNIKNSQISHHITTPTSMSSACLSSSHHPQLRSFFTLHIFIMPHRNCEVLSYFTFSFLSLKMMLISSICLLQVIIMLDFIIIFTKSAKKLKKLANYATKNFNLIMENLHLSKNVILQPLLMLKACAELFVCCCRFNNGNFAHYELPFVLIKTERWMHTIRV